MSQLLERKTRKLSDLRQSLEETDSTLDLCKAVTYRIAAWYLKLH